MARSKWMAEKGVKPASRMLGGLHVDPRRSRTGEFVTQLFCPIEPQ
jgi:hypothetical protein